MSFTDFRGLPPSSFYASSSTYSTGSSSSESVEFRSTGTPECSSSESVEFRSTDTPEYSSTAGVETPTLEEAESPFEAAPSFDLQKLAETLTDYMEELTGEEDYSQPVEDCINELKKLWGEISETVAAKLIIEGDTETDAYATRKGLFLLIGEISKGGEATVYKTTYFPFTNQTLQNDRELSQDSGPVEELVLKLIVDDFRYSLKRARQVQEHVDAFHRAFINIPLLVGKTTEEEGWIVCEECKGTILNIPYNKEAEPASKAVDVFYKTILGAEGLPGTNTDLKGQNILYRGNEIIITDFGGIVTPEKKRAICITPGYCPTFAYDENSPGQATYNSTLRRSVMVTHKIMIHALGVTLQDDIILILLDCFTRKLFKKLPEEEKSETEKKIEEALSDLEYMCLGSGYDEEQTKEIGRKNGGHRSFPVRFGDEIDLYLKPSLQDTRKYLGDLVECYRPVIAHDQIELLHRLTAYALKLQQLNCPLQNMESLRADFERGFINGAVEKREREDDESGDYLFGLPLKQPKVENSQE